MDDAEALLRAAGYARAVSRVRYADVFAAEFGCSPHALPTAQLAALAARQPVTLSQADLNDRALLFDCLYACVLEPALAAHGAVLLYDFPSQLRAYARLSATVPAVAARCELIVDGLEIANGYYEIIDADEQAQCFAAENAVRQRRGLATVAPDRRWLEALAAGLPPCAGMALGIERLLLISGLGQHIRDVTSFGAELDGLE